MTSALTQPTARPFRGRQRRVRLTGLSPNLEFHAVVFRGYAPNNVVEALSADFYISFVILATVLGVVVA